MLKVSKELMHYRLCELKGCIAVFGLVARSTVSVVYAVSSALNHSCNAGCSSTVYLH